MKDHLSRSLPAILAASVIAAALFVLCGCFGGLVGKTDNKPDHTHTFSTRWSYDDTYHYHEATCGCKDVVGDKAEHTWADGYELTGNGHRHTCSVCGFKKILPHSVENFELVSAAVYCTDGDVYTGTCSICGKTVTEKRNVSEHDIPTEYTLEDGMHVRRCSKCTYEDSHTAELSSYNRVVGKEPTCTEDGYYTGRCSNCPTAMTEPIPALEHNWNKVNKSVYDPFDHSFTCERCGDVEPIGHTFGEVQLSEGLTHKRACSECGFTAYEFHTFLSGVCTVCGFTRPQSTGLSYTGVYDGGTLVGYSVEKGGFSGKYLVIPESYNGLPVLEIPANAFRDQTQIESVEIPDSVRFIGETAFYNCPKVVSIRVPFAGSYMCEPGDGKTQYPFGYIFGNARDGTQYAGSAILTYSYYDADIDGIQYFSFLQPRGLRNIKIGGGRLNYGAVMGTGLYSLVLEEGVTAIDENGYRDNSYGAHVHIPASVTSIQARALPTFASAHIADANPEYKEVGGSIVEKNGSKLFAISKSGTIPSDGSITAISTGLFENATVKFTTIPSSLSDIGDRAFKNCSSIETVELTGDDIVIGEEAFAGMADLKTVRITAKTLSIGEKAFKACPALKTVEINCAAGGAIGEEAFFNCNAVTGIRLSGVTEIGRAAFYCAYALTDLDLGNVASIGEIAFGYSRMLTELTVPRSVTELAGDAFVGASALERVNWNVVGGSGIAAGPYFKDSVLTSVVFGNDVREIPEKFLYGERAGRKCQYALRSLVLPAGLVKIGSNAFADMYSVPSVTIPDTVEYIGERAFYGWSALTEISIGSAVVYVGNAAFGYCEKMTKVVWNATGGDCPAGPYFYVNVTELTLGPAVRYIPEKAFYGLTKITGTLTVPTGVLTIGRGAFAGMKISAIDLPFVGESASATGEGALFGHIFGPYPFSAATAAAQLCEDGTTVENYIPDALRTVTVRGGTPGYGAFSGVSKITSVDLSGARFNAVPDNAFNGCTNLYGIDLPAGILSVGDNAFKNTQISSVAVSGATSLGSGAFESCGNILSFTVPAGVSALPANAFAQCSNLAEINIHSGVTSIGEGAFMGCSALSSLALPSAVTAIPAHAFEDCVTLSSFNIPSGVTSIGESAFKNCRALTALAIPVGVTAIPAHAFDGCTVLALPAISSAITSIGDYAFRGCAAIECVSIPATLGFIGEGVFYGCTSLTEVSISSTVTVIPAELFYGCSQLSTLSLGASDIAEIGSGAFYGCASLTAFDLTGVAEIGGNAFYGAGLTSVAIPATVTKIGGGAFRSCAALVTVTYSPEEIQTDATSLTPIFGGSAVETVSLAAGVKKLPKFIFYGCKNLTGITIVSGITEIGEGAFGSSGLAAVALPASVVAVGKNAFSRAALSSLVIDPTSNAVIQNGAFAFTKITSFVLPAGVTPSEGMLAGCKELASITLPFTGLSATATGADALFGKLFGDLTTAEVVKTTQYYNELETYTAYLPQSLVSVEFSGSAVKAYAFNGVSVIEAVRLTSASSTTVGAHAFENCVNLQSVSFASQTTVGNSAFKHCSRLVNNASVTGITLDKVVSVGDEAFLDCFRGWTVEMSDVDYIGARAFYGVAAEVNVSGYALEVGEQAFFSYLLKNATVGAASSIGLGAFGGTAELSLSVPFIGASALPSTYEPAARYSAGHFFGRTQYDGGVQVTQHISMSVTAAFYFPAKLTVTTSAARIPQGAFLDCTTLRRVAFQTAGCTVDEIAFSGCTALSTVAGTVGNVGAAGFGGCTALTSITVSGEMGERAFMSSGLRTVSMTGATIIKKQTFYGCSQLTAVTVPDSVTEIETNAFGDCTNLASVSIGSGVKTIGQNAFRGCNVTSATFAVPTGWWLSTQQLTTQLSQPASASTVLRNGPSATMIWRS